MAESRRRRTDDAAEPARPRAGVPDGTPDGGAPDDGTPDDGAPAEGARAEGARDEGARAAGVRPGAGDTADATPTTRLPVVPVADEPAADEPAADEPAATAAMPTEPAPQEASPGSGVASSGGGGPAYAAGSVAAAAGATGAPHGGGSWGATPQPWQPPTYGEWEAGQGRPTSSGSLRRAVTGVPVGDWVRDAVAALLLLLSLGVAVDFQHEGRGRLAVVAVTLVALLALAVPYVVRGGLFGDRADARRAGLVRLGLAAPYVVMVLVMVVRDLVAGDDPVADGGLGVGLGIGLGGALLAMSPRAEETGALDGPGERARGLDRAWFAVPAAVAAVSAVWAVGSLVAFLAQADTDVYSGAELFALILRALVAPTVIGLGAIGLLRRDEGWRLAVAAIAGAPILLFLVADPGEVAVSHVETVHTLTTGVWLWPAVAAAAWAVSTGRGMRVSRTRWAEAASRVLVVTTVVGAIWLLASLLLAAGTDDTSLWLVQAVLALLYVGLAVLAWLLLRPGRPFAVARLLVLAGGLALVGLAAIVVQVASDVVIDGTDLLLAVVLPVALAAFVLAQASHEARGVGVHPAFAAQQQWAAQQRWVAQQQWAAQQWPVAPPAPAPEANDAVRMAQDPATPQATLADLATRVPETRVHIARHPAAYPALLDWLAALGDPEVTRAVAERRAVGG